MRDIDKFRGCLIGGAAGDALGFAVEFLREEQIFSKYGDNGITDYSLKKGIAEISDDTQMTLFTANGLLLGTTRGMTRGIMGSYESYIKIMYQCWYRTQTESYPINDDYLYSWLLNVPELFARRAPGITCLSAIEHGAEGSTSEPINNSKGCGGVMRVAPIGLYFCDKSISYEKSDMIGAEAAAITHGHDLGFIPAAALVHIIRSIIENGATISGAVNETINAMQALFPKAKHISDFTDIMQKAVMLAETGDALLL
ncbi:ADP-ribosylglycohydrolase family protein [Ruminococcus flavefaciens]|uniref:ADP-ribosylglycohydrolase family protein n=1 Tax=Ruminococcus flavefaciens TaxID=1265 RepID=UPI0026EA49FF|nr:ADP-ribosylglycohydrolase family protein [Ruminococcus flavefaciens]